MPAPIPLFNASTSSSAMSCRVILALLILLQVAPVAKVAAGLPFLGRSNSVPRSAQEDTFRISAAARSHAITPVSSRRHRNVSIAQEPLQVAMLDAEASLQECTEDSSQQVDDQNLDDRQAEAPDASLGKKTISGCTASSEQASSWSCAKAFDGNVNTDWATQGEGMCSWITLQFAKPVKVNMMKYANRIGKERNKGVQLQFSDGSVETVQLKDDFNLNSFQFPEKITRFVKIQVKSTYSTLNNGAKEIEFWHIDGLNCADALVVSGSDTHQASRMGVYFKRDILPENQQAGRPIYQSANKQNYLYYWSAAGAWRIGSNYASASAGVISKSYENTTCPTQASAWSVHAVSKWSSSSVTVKPRT